MNPAVVEVKIDVLLQLISFFRNRLLSRATKIRLYKTLIRPVVTCGAETWMMTKKEEQYLLIFER